MGRWIISSTRRPDLPASLVSERIVSPQTLPPKVGSGDNGQDVVTQWNVIIDHVMLRVIY